jgi:thioesterase domain-containing protein
MLVPLQTSGNKPPLFFVHGIRGIAFAVGPRFARLLGPDQPFYVINANGIDGQQPVLDDVPEMIAAYSQEIRKVWPTGPVRIGGMCSGGMVAIEIARGLRHEGRQTGPVILIDPPVLPVGYEHRPNTIDVSPELANRFLREVRVWLLQKISDPDDSENLPFNPRDHRQLQAAATVATRTTVAFAKYVPRPFSGSIHAILSENRASGFLHPQMPWRKLLPGPRVIHVVPWPHMELFQAGRQTVARLLKFMLDDDSWSENLALSQMPAAAYAMPEARP